MVKCCFLVSAVVTSLLRAQLTFSAFILPGRCSQLDVPALLLTRTQLLLSPDHSSDVSCNSRRDCVIHVAGSISSFGLAILGASRRAAASGGATAGGVYLLSAKQRYNKRVEATVKSFSQLASSLDEGSLDAAKSFFADEKDGGWKSGRTAGYLLANAFRRSSATPPDSLPAVKKWKAFAAKVDAMAKSVEKGDVQGAQASFKKGKELLVAYLDEVELPSVI